MTDEPNRLVERHYGVSGVLVRQLEAYEQHCRATSDQLAQVLTDALVRQAAEPNGVVEISPDGEVGVSPTYEFAPAGRPVYRPGVGYVSLPPANPTREGRAFQNRLARRRAANKAAKKARQRNRK